MTGEPDLQVTVVDTSNVQVVYPSATTASTRKPPLLALELQVSDGTSITCKTDLDSIVPRMLAVFDKAITATQVHDILNQMWGLQNVMASRFLSVHVRVDGECLHCLPVLIDMSCTSSTQLNVGRLSCFAEPH